MSSHSMRPSFPARLCLGGVLLLGSALPTALPVLAQPAADPVLATVNGQPIHLSDVKDAAQSLPQCSLWDRGALA